MLYSRSDTDAAFRESLAALAARLFRGKDEQDMELTGAGIVVEELIRQKVETVFGYPGGYVIDIYDELYRNSDRINHVLTAHEQGAAHAADAYARVSGRVSAVIATGGPGATNLVTGIANAYLDSVPVVFITGNVPVPMLGGDSFQEIDTVGVTLPIVKHNYVVKDVRNLQGILNQAFLIAGTGRKGPVLVDIPQCVQQSNYGFDPDLRTTMTGAKRPADLSSLFDARDAIAKSERPYIYCGGGVSATGMGAEVMELSRKLGAPVGLSMMGIGSVPDSYELNLGMCGMHGRYASTMAKSESDLIIALGVRFSDRATGSTKGYAKNSKILHVDIDAAEIGKNVRADISLCGDLREILPKLLEIPCLEKSEKSGKSGKAGKSEQSEKWLERVRELKAQGNAQQNEGFSPRSIIERINAFYDEDTVVATDVGQHQMWVAQHYRFEKPRRLITSGGLGAMGYGLGAAIGASIARGRRRTVLFTGEGSFGMNLTELATAVTEKLPITIILLNNGVLGMVRQWQALFFGQRYSQTTLDRKTDFPALSKAFGAAGYTANSLSELSGILRELPDDGPSLVECKIGMDERVLPMIPVGGSIGDMVTN